MIDGISKYYNFEWAFPLIPIDFWIWNLKYFYESLGDFLCDWSAVFVVNQTITICIKLKIALKSFDDSQSIHVWWHLGNIVNEEINIKIYVKCDNQSSLFIPFYAYLSWNCLSIKIKVITKMLDSFYKTLMNSRRNLIHLIINLKQD